MTEFSKNITFGGWSNCLRLTNSEIELIVTTDIGPRVIHLSFQGEANIFQEFLDDLGKTGGDKWRIYGGHRFWHAPEDPARTYCPDNDPVEYRFENETLILRQPVESLTGIQKEMEIQIGAASNTVSVVHTLHNCGSGAVELAPWALSVMAQGGRTIIPQEDSIRHTEKLTPARPLVLWHYTDMTDPRWKFGAKYIQLRQDPEATDQQKIGVYNSKGWAAYTKDEVVFVKHFEVVAGARHAHMGCNNETFTNSDMIELETSGPLELIAPGDSVSHKEVWYLERRNIGESEEEIDRQLLPIVDRLISEQRG